MADYVPLAKDIRHLLCNIGNVWIASPSACPLPRRTRAPAVGNVEFYQEIDVMIMAKLHFHVVLEEVCELRTL